VAETALTSQRPWNLSRPDWRDRIRAGLSLMPELPELDQARAAKAKRIFNRLRIPDVPGQPTFGDAGGDWFRDVVGAMHGSIDTTGKRQIEAFFGLVPKKNAKTTNGAGMMMTELLLNEVQRQNFTLIGATQKISETAYNQVEGFLAADRQLATRFKVQSHLKRITYLPTESKLEVKSFDPNVVTGINGSFLLDELHLLGDDADADRVIGQLTGGTIARPQAFGAFITTQSERPPAGVFAAQLRKARAIRDGKADGRMLAILYEFPEELVPNDLRDGETPPWHDPKNWPMVLPNLGRSIASIERLIEGETGFKAAQLAGEEEVRRWASQHLNIEIGLALRSDRWPGADHWLKNADRTLTLDELLTRSEVVVVGIDGGGLDDLLGLSVLGRERKPEEEVTRRRWLHWGHAWAHPDVLERRKDIVPRLMDFAADGDLTLVKEIGKDVAKVADIVQRCWLTGLMPEKAAIGVDPAGIGGIVDEIALREIDTTPEAGIVVGIPQGWTMTGAITTIARKLAGRSFIHGGSRLMTWSVENARQEPRGNAVVITKQASGRAKIDPLMATFNAGSLMSRNPTAGRSVYEERGLLLF
jgi:phage terminase large subunit-like protein